MTAAANRKVNWDIGIDLDDLKKDFASVGTELKTVTTAINDFAKQADKAAADAASDFKAFSQALHKDVVDAINAVAGALKPVRDEAKSLGTEVGAVLRDIKRQVDATDKAIRQSGMSESGKLADNYATAIAKAKNQVDELKKSLAAANITDKERLELANKIAEGEANIAKLVAQSKTHVDQARQAEEQRLDAVKASSQALSQSLRELAVGAGVVGGALAAGIGGAVQEFGNFEAQMLSFGAVSQSSDTELRSVEETALRLGASTKFTAQEVASAAVELAKMGFSATETNQAMDAMVTASIASGESLGDVSNTVATTIRMFNMQASDAQKVSDIITRGANISAQSFGSYADSIRYVGSAAAAANQDLVQVAGLLDILADRGIKGAQAGNGLQNTLLRLQAPTKAAREAMEKLNLSITDTKGTASSADDTLKPMLTIIKEIKAEFEHQGTNSIGQADLLKDMFGEVALNSMQVFMNTSNEVMDATMAKQQQFAGSTASTADEVQKGFNHAIEEMKSAINGLQISMGKELAPTLKTLAGLVQDLVDSLDKIPAPLKATAAEAGLAGVALAGVISILGGGSWAVIGMISLFGKLKAEMVSAGVEAGLLKTSLGGLLGATGVGFVIGGGINLAMNSIADNLNKRSDAIDQGIAEDQKTKGGLATALRTGDKKLDVEQTRKAAVEAINNLQRLKSEVSSVDGQLADLEVYAQRAIRYGADDAKKENERQKSALESKKASLMKEIEQQEQLKQKYQSLLQVKKEDAVAEQKKAAAAKDSAAAAGDRKKAEEAAADARKKADKEQIKANKDQFRQWEEGDKAFEASLKGRAGAATETSSQIQVADTQMAVNLTHSAKSIASSTNTIGACYNGVHRAFMQAFGKSPFQGMHAWMGADNLAKDTRFIEVQIKQRSDLLKLAAGSVVVWGKGSSKSGHISIADGQGNEYSDHVAKQMTSHYGGADPRVFVMRGQEGRMGGVNGAADQARINAEIAHYNEQLKKAVAFRAELERHGLKDTESWNQANSKVAEYQNKLQKLAGASADAFAKSAEDLRKLQEKNVTELAQEVSRISKEVSGQIDGLLKDLDQKNMSSAQKAADNFSRSIEKAQNEVLNLRVKLNQLNLSEEQRARVSEDIKNLNQDIADLLSVQDRTLAQMHQTLVKGLLKDFGDDEAKAKIDDMADSLQKTYAIIDAARDKELKAMQKKREEYEKSRDLVAKRKQASAERDRIANVKEIAPDASYKAAAEYSNSNAEYDFNAKKKSKEDRAEADRINKQVEEDFKAKQARVEKEANLKKLIAKIEEERRQRDVAFSAQDQAIDEEKAKRLQTIERSTADGLTLETDAVEQKATVELEYLNKKLAIQKQVTAAQEKDETLAILSAQRTLGKNWRQAKSYQDASKKVQDSKKKEADISRQIDDQSIADTNRATEKKKRAFNEGVQLASSAVSEMAGLLKQLTKESNAAIGDVIDGITGIGAGLASLATGNPLGAFQVIGSLFNMTLNLVNHNKQAVIEYRQELEKIKLLAIDEDAQAKQRAFDDARNAGASNNELVSKGSDAAIAKAKGAMARILDQAHQQLGLDFAIDTKNEAPDFQEAIDRYQKEIDNQLAKGKKAGDPLLANLQSKLVILKELNSQVNNAYDQLRTDLQNNSKLATGTITDTLTQEQKAVQDYLKKTVEEPAADKSLKEKFMQGLHLPISDKGMTDEMQASLNTIGDNYVKNVRDIQKDIAQNLRGKPIDVDWSNLDALPEDVRNAFWDRYIGMYEGVQDQIDDALKKTGEKALQDMEKVRKEAQDKLDKDLKDNEAKYKANAEALKKARTDLYNNDVKQIQNLIDNEQLRLDAINKQNQAYQQQIKDKEDLLKQDLKQFDAQDKGIFANLMKQQDMPGEIRAGLGDIANPEGTPTGTFSAQSIQEAMKARVELMTLQNENQYKLEEITKDEYLRQQQKIAAIQAGFADQALQAENLTNRQRLELEQSKADAYVMFQQAYRQSLQDRFQAESDGINASIEANNKQAAVIQANIDGEKNQIDGLTKTYQASLQSIDTAVSAVLDAHDAWQVSAEALRNGVEGPLSEMLGMYQRVRDAAQIAFSSTPGMIAESDRYYPSGSSGSSTYTPYVDTLPAFANGGVVGKGYPNDSLIAKLSSDEVVLSPHNPPTWLTAMINQNPLLMTGGQNQTFNSYSRPVEININGGDEARVLRVVRQALKESDSNQARINGHLFGPLN